MNLLDLIGGEMLPRTSRYDQPTDQCCGDNYLLGNGTNDAAKAASRDSFVKSTFRIFWLKL